MQSNGVGIPEAETIHTDSRSVPLAIRSEPLLSLADVLGDEQTGCEEQEKMEDCGREDNSYFCQFSFVQ